MHQTAFIFTLGLTTLLFASAVGCSSEEPNDSIFGVGGSVASGGANPGSGGQTLNSGGGGGQGSGGSPDQPSGGSAGDGSGGGPATGGSGSGGAEGSGGSNSAPATVTPGTCKADLGGYQNGSVTYYTFAMGTTEGVNCGNPEMGRNPDRLDYVETGDGTYFGAMNTADYDTAATCGACVEVTRDGNRKVVITIADRCPIETNNKCKNGHIDLSQQAFNQLGNQSEGYLGTGNGGMYGQISWKYVPCPDGSTVVFTLKEGDNEFWNQVLVSGHRYEIEKVEVLVNGTWVNAVRQMYNYWEPPEGIMGEESPYRVRVTDVNGSIIEAPVALMAGGQDSKVQFECN